MKRDPHCPSCGGQGFIPIDGLTTKRCICSHRVALFNIVGKDIYDAPGVEPNQSPLQGNVDRNVAFVGRMAAVAPHLRLGVGSWYMSGKSVVLVTDTEVNRRKFEPKPRGEESSDYDMLSNPDLLVIFVGYTPYQQAAAGDIVRIRGKGARITWVVADHPPSTAHSELASATDGFLVLHFEAGRRPESPPRRDEAPQTAPRSARTGSPYDVLDDDAHRLDAQRVAATLWNR